MPLYRVTTYKEYHGVPFEGEKWTNVYHCFTDNVTGAIATGEFAAEAEMAVSYEPVTAYAVTAVNTANKNDKAKSAIALDGQLSITGLGGPLPMFNVVRVIFSDSLERAESKYLRTAAQRDNIEGGSWSEEYVTFVQTNYTEVILGELTMRGPNNEVLTGGRTQDPVQNRQLGWHRRSRPGQKRGWVPA